MSTTQNSDHDLRIRLAKQHIRSVLAKSPVPEDAGHAENTRQWLLRLEPSVDVAQRLAALAHDIERARPDRLHRDDFECYDTFKTQHAALGAAITDTILTQFNIDTGIRRAVYHLVSRHEHGGDPGSDLLKDADSLSYFEHNLPFYYQREGWDETLRRAHWGYQRLSIRAQGYYRLIRHSDPHLQRLLYDAAQDGSPA